MIGSKASAIHARGAIFMVDLEPVRGSEQGRTRPCVTVSVDEMNVGRTLVMVPFTTQGERYREDPAFVVRVPPRQSGLQQESFAMAHQIRTVSKDRLQRHVGNLVPEAMAKLEAAMRYVQGLE